MTKTWPATTTLCVRLPDFPARGARWDRGHLPVSRQIPGV